MKEIGLQELLEQVKRELLAPNPAARVRDPYPCAAEALVKSPGGLASEDE